MFDAVDRPQRGDRPGAVRALGEAILSSATAFRAAEEARRKREEEERRKREAEQQRKREEEEARKAQEAEEAEAAASRAEAAAKAESEAAAKAGAEAASNTPVPDPTVPAAGAGPDSTAKSSAGPAGKASEGASK